MLLVIGIFALPSLLNWLPYLKLYFTTIDVAELIVCRLTLVIMWWVAIYGDDNKKQCCRTTRKSGNVLTKLNL